MAFNGKYAPRYRRAAPTISISGVEDARQATELVERFEKTGCSSHILEISGQTSQLTLAGIKTSKLRLLPFEINRIADAVARANSKSALFSVHHGIEKTDGLNEEQAEAAGKISKIEPWKQLYSAVSVPHLSLLFERSLTKYGIRANFGWDEQIINNFGKMEAAFPKIFTCMEVRDTSGAHLLRGVAGLNYLVVNLPQTEGIGFDAQASVAAAELFLGQGEYFTIGFAGGLKPDTIGATILELSELAKTVEFSIGLESGIRTEGRFDMEKAAKAIEEAASAFKKRRALLRAAA